MNRKEWLTLYNYHFLQIFIRKNTSGKCNSSIKLCVNLVLMTSDKKLFEPDYSKLAIFIFQICVSNYSLTSNNELLKIVFILIRSIFRIFFLGAKELALKIVIIVKLYIFDSWNIFLLLIGESIHIW